MKDIRFLVTLGFTLLACITSAALAAPAGLDPTFGAGGKVMTEFGGGSDRANAVAVQSDGKIIAAGSANDGTGENLAVARYNLSGSLDTTFNGTGMVTTDLGGDRDSIVSVLVQSDGRIIVAGNSLSGPEFSEMRRWVLVRYNADGSLDTTFNGTGKVMTDFGRLGFAASAALQSDGRIVVAGSAYEEFPGGGYNRDIALARYNRDGSLDTSFNGTGRVITVIAGSLSAAGSVIVQNDGNIVATGTASSPAPTIGDVVLVRYLTTGALDTSLNGTGIVRTVANGHVGIYGGAVQSDGRIVVAGYREPGSFQDDFFVTRYLANGALDVFAAFPHADFGGDDEARSVVVQSDGSVVTAGFGSSDFALARYTNTGSFDTTFNLTGKVTTDFSGGDDAAYGMTLQSDGRIVVAGDAHNGSNRDFALARYQGDLVAPEINLAGSSGMNIADGDTMPSPDDQTDFGPNNVHAAPVSRSFSVRNSGTGTLRLYAPTLSISGPHATEFAVIAYPQSTLAPGGSTGFTVSFDPRGTGLRTATITIVSDDSDERVFEFAVQGNGLVLTGDPDPAFGTMGTVTTDFNTFDTGAGVAVQSDGRIVVAGSAAHAGVSDFALARYHPDGSPDTSFNGTGRVTTDLGSGDEAGQCVAIQSDGKIVVAGYFHNGTNHDFAVVRYSGTGALDTSFNGTGIVITPIGSGDEQASSVALQDNGRIVVAGYSQGATNANFAVVCYTAGGALDVGFNGTGRRTTNFGGHDYARGVAVQSDGRIVVAGYTQIRTGPLTTTSIALARYTAAGALDASLNGTGTVSTLVGTDAFGYGLALQCDGRILVAGFTRDTAAETGGMALVRYTPGGSLDTSFNGTGIAPVVPDVAATSVAVQADGRIVVGGGELDFVLARFTPAGWYDFGFNFGVVTTNLSTTGSGTSTQTSRDTGAGVAILTDGSIVLAGSTEIPAGYSDFALVRYVNDSPRIMFDNVAAAAGLTGPAAEPNASPFHDGITNLVKYATGMNLAGPDVHTLPVGGNSGLPAGRFVAAGGQTWWQMEYVRRKGTGLTFTPLKSATLVPGSFALVTGQITVHPLAADCERVIVREPVDPAAPRFFSRLQVTLP